MKRKRVIFAVVAALVAIAATQMIRTSGEATGTWRFYSGPIVFSTNSDLQPFVLNPTSKTITVTGVVLGAGGPITFTDVGPKTLHVPPHSAQDLKFNCPSGVTPCIGTVLLTAPSGAIEPSLFWEDPGASAQATHGLAGDWRIIAPR